MRKTAIALLGVVLIGASFGGGAKLFTETSRDYAVWITATRAAGDTTEYDVRITDRKSSALVAQRRVTTSVGTPAEVTIDGGDGQFKLRIGPRPEGLHVQLNVEKSGSVVDWFNVYWDTGSPEGPMSSEGKARVGGDVKAPVVIERVDPLYTDAAKRDRIAGIIIAEVLIDKTGVMREIRILKSLPDGLADSAIDALRQWRFQPATRNGEPVDAIFNLTVNFTP